MYFDTDGLPTMDTHRKYGYRKEYNANEHLAAVIYLDFPLSLGISTLLAGFGL